MKRIAVIGDSMLDVYLHGTSSRISPEAPVPIVKVEQSSTFFLGGCCNVANNLRTLGEEVFLFSSFGLDLYGKKLINLLEQKKIDYYVIKNDNDCTITKQRIMANGQQCLRIDYNDTLVISIEEKERFLCAFTEKIRDFDIVILSDYGKGVCDFDVCQRIISICLKNNIRIIVDPKGNDWGKYSGSFLITPNLNEINNVLKNKISNSDEEIGTLSQTFFSSLNIQNLLITRSEKGMSLINSDGVFHLSTVAKQVFDVSGAGDTVVATIASFLKDDKCSLLDAVRYSNYAAGIVVGKKGISTVTKEEILSDNEKNVCAPIFGLDEYGSLLKLLLKWRKDGLSIVTTNGCFDVVHKGHISLIKSAKKMGDKLIVCINSDDSVKRLKGPSRPINNCLDRCLIISSIIGVDAVVVFDEKKNGTYNCDAPMTLLEMIKPDVHIKGGDYTEEQVPEAKFAKRFMTIDFIEGYSTTNIVKRKKDE